MNIFWQLTNDLKTIRAISQATDAQTKARYNQLELKKLEQKIEKALLASAAMWSLIADNTSLTDHDLAERMRELDLQDGRRDDRIDEGKMVKQRHCPRCSREVRTLRSWCFYCGAELDGPALPGTDRE
jgi:hypothetical protein